LQDPRRPDPEAKRWLPKTLGPEPSCCLQDWPRAGVNPAVAEESDSARRTGAWRSDTASSTPGSWSATSARCRDRPGDTRHRWQVAASGFDCDAAVGTAWLSTWSAQGESGKEQTAFGKNSNAADSSFQNLRLSRRRVRQEEPPRSDRTRSFRENSRLEKNNFCHRWVSNSAHWPVNCATEQHGSSSTKCEVIVALFLSCAALDDRLLPAARSAIPLAGNCQSPAGDPE